MTTEKDAFKYLSRMAPSHCLLQRVENSVGTGLPDVFFRTRGAEGWIENKVGVLSRGSRRNMDPSNSFKVRVPKSKLRPEQAAWLTSYTGLGGNGYIFVFIPPGLHSLMLPFSTYHWEALGDARQLWFWKKMCVTMTEVFRGT
jgi:hypothetical protein